MREDPGFGWGLLDSRPNRKTSLLCNEVPHDRGRLRETAQRLGFGRGVVFRGYWLMMGQTNAPKKPITIRMKTPITELS